MTTYDDFLIQLGPETEAGIHVRVSCPRGGEESGTFVCSRPSGAVGAAFGAAVRGAGSRDLAPQPSQAPPLDPREIGRYLFDTLFQGSVRRVFDRSLRSTSSFDSAGLRFKIQVDLRDPAQVGLHALPWELLFRSDTEEFLALSRRTPVVRYLSVPREVQSHPLPDTLRVLVLSPEPRDVPALDLAGERRGLEALRDRVANVEVEFLPTADLTTLRAALLEREAQVLHFMGHGGFDPKTGEGCLCLESPGGASDRVPAGTFVDTIRDFPGLRLVVLNACNSGRAGGGEVAQAFAGLAPALMRAGIPAVLAMQLPISDRAAIAFSEAFYRRLGAGDPVDAAVSEGRLAIARADRRSAEWAIPALFLRVPNGHLFETAAGPGASGAPAGGATATGFRPQPSWKAFLRAGDYEGACRELRQEIALDPEAGLSVAALAIALTRGASLKSLPYARAKEIHALLVRSLATATGGGLAALCLVALKLDYFRANAVREPPPDLEDVLRVAAGSNLAEEEQELLGFLRVSARAREIATELQPLWRKS